MFSRDCRMSRVGHRPLAGLQDFFSEIFRPWSLQPPHCSLLRIEVADEFVDEILDYFFFSSIRLDDFCGE